LDSQFNKALEVCNFVKKVDSSSMADYRIGEIHYYLGKLEKSKSIFNQIQSSIHMKVGALYYLGMIAAQYKDLEKVQNIIVKLENFPKVLLDNHFRTASLYFGIGNEEEGFKYSDDFFNKPSTQKQKFIYKRYISLDRNFDKYNSIIGRKYFE
jgi:tetratricopeptide (TPR) repeat protein